MSRNSEQQLIKNLNDSVKERLQWNIDNNELEGMDRDQIIESLEDVRYEIIDGELPIYYSDMAKLLAENTNFAYVDDEGCLPENPSVWDIITMSVSQFLDGEFSGIACDVVDELLPNLGNEEEE